MKTKSRSFMCLVIVLMFCIVGLTASVFGVKNVNASTVTSISSEDVVVSNYDQKLNVSDARYSGLYEIRLNFGVVLNSTSSGGTYSIMDGSNKSVQEYILINGVSAKDINTNVDDSDYYYPLFPWSNGSTYAVPVLMFVPYNVEYITMNVHADYIASLDGKMEITIKNGFSYTDGTSGTIYSYNGEDITYKFMASQWYKAGTEPTAVANGYTEITASLAQYEVSSKNDRIAIPLDQLIQGDNMIGAYHITQPQKVWNQLQHYIKINGQTLSQINTNFDDSDWDYSSANWFLAWAGNTADSGYCQPAYVQLSSSSTTTLYINMHDELRDKFISKGIVIELLPGFGVYDSSNGIVKLNTNREILVIMKDVNNITAMAKATQSNGISVNQKSLSTTTDNDEFYFDLTFSADIMLDNHYTGPVTFDYVGDIWKNYVFVGNASISDLADYCRVVVASGTTFAEKNKVRVYIKESAYSAGMTITLKEGMPFSSGEVLESDYVITFKALPAVDSQENAVMGWTDGTTTWMNGAKYATCLKAGSTESELKAIYQITYVLDGGVNNIANPNYYVGGVGTALANPTKSGYVFKGWSSDEGAITSISNSTYGPITLTAMWEEVVEYSITYVLDGGTNHTENPQLYNKYSDTIVLKAPTKNGYDFTGWKKGSLAGDTITEIVGGSEGDLTLYASWSIKNYTLTYELSGGTNGENPANYNIESEIITLAPATRKGYTFVKWTMDSEDVTTIASGSTGDKTLVAVWQEDEYTISYVLGNGGIGDPLNPTAYTVNSDAITFKNPVRAGYNFVKWTINDVDATGIASGSAGNVTVTAVWQAIEYTITYVLDGGTNATSNPTTYTVESDSITFATPTKEGYTFVKWTVDGVDSTGVAKGSMGNLTVTAVWQQNASDDGDNSGNENTDVPPSSDGETEGTDGGCGSSVTGGIAVAIVSVLGGAMLVVKKSRKE